ncbi:MAG TPA: AI-2E family transporter [Alphaproteobacteria bacterium]|nr:AI-2E family transporter [Alphaproteobacteria bacterium]
MRQQAEHPLLRQNLFWGAIALAAILLVWLLRGMLLPFLLGMALAYVSDPFADRLERLRIPRWLATLIVLGLIVGGGILTLVLVAPLIVNQIMQLAQQAPHYIDVLRHRILPEITSFVARVGGPSDAADLQKQATAYVGSFSSWVVSILGQIWSSGVAIANTIYVLLLTPLVAFYFLRDWDHMIARIDGWMPRAHAGMFRGLAHEIDDILAGFIRGQATVCLIFAVYYSVALSLAGLNFGIIIGIAAGVLTFIPYLGAIAGLIASIGVAFVQFDDYTRIAIVAGVYILGHLIEGNVVTPVLVGDRVKLHPVWIIFALAAGGALFGFTGVLLAVPVAAVIGVLVRFGLTQYLDSDFYDSRAEPLPPVSPGEL